MRGPAAVRPDRTQNNALRTTAGSTVTSLQLSVVSFSRSCSNPMRYARFRNRHPSKILNAPDAGGSPRHMLEVVFKKFPEASVESFFYVKEDEERFLVLVVYDVL